MNNNDALDDELTGALEAFKKMANKDTENSLPCIVKMVSPDRTRVTVQPLISMVDNDGVPMPRGDLVDVPVFNAGAGNVVVSFAIAPGNIGWIDAKDRDMSIFLQSYAQSIPGSKRMHKFNDGVFTPDHMRQFNIAQEDAISFLIQTVDGLVKIALDNTSIRITNGTTTTITTAASITAICGTTTTTITPSTASVICGTTTLASDSSNYNIQTPAGVINLNGLTVQPNGDWSTASGASSVGGDVSSSTGVTLNTHVHGETNTVTTPPIAPGA